MTPKFIFRYATTEFQYRDPGFNLNSRSKLWREEEEF